MTSFLMFCQCDFNPRPPWGGRPGRTRANAGYRRISIHALRGEGDSHIGGTQPQTGQFQSTPSVGRATNLPLPVGASFRISIHALRGEGDRRDRNALLYVLLFQSMPSVGRATAWLLHAPPKRAFQSTPSVGRATCVDLLAPYQRGISIHALRGEGDYASFTAVLLPNYFNPRPPWGGRQQ